MKYVKILKKDVLNRIGFSTFEIAKLFGTPRSSLQQYLDRGFISPSIEKAQGKGTRNRFSTDDLYQVRIFQKLHSVGLPQKEASEMSYDILLKVKEIVNVDWVYITPQEKEIHFIKEHEYRRAFEDPSGVFICINILSIMKEVDELVKE